MSDYSKLSIMDDEQLLCLMAATIVTAPATKEQCEPMTYNMAIGLAFAMRDTIRQRLATEKQVSKDKVWVAAAAKGEVG